MKIKTTKVCKNKGCNREFRAYKTTDKYCSASCVYANAKPKKKQKRIPPISEKRKKESYEYSKKRKTFLAKEENKFCPVAKMFLNHVLPKEEREFWLRNQQATEIHHKAGRKGKLLNYVPLWLAVGREGHNWIHANPTESYRLGFLIKPSTVNI